MSSKTPTAAEIEKQGRVLVLAERVRLLFGFCADLIPDLDILKDTAQGAGSRASDVLSMAPILGAFGQDYEAIHFKKNLEARRAHALYELIKVLHQTEEERKEFQKKKEEMSEGLAQIAEALGGL